MGWETRQLASVCEVFADGDWIESKDQSETGVRLIQTGNVGEGVFKDRVEKARYVSVETFKRLRCTEIFPGDCLISRLPDPVGRACIIPDTGEAMITAVDCTIVRFREAVYLPEFFTYYSQSLDYLTAVDAETTGTTRKRISRARLGQVAVPLPPVPEQRRIVAILDEAFDAIATAKANTEKNLQNARELFEQAVERIFIDGSSRWRSHPLDTIGKTQTGSTPKSSEPEHYGEALPFIKPGDFRPDGTLDYENDGLSELGASRARVVPAGSALMVCIGATIGKAGFCDRPIATNQQINAWTPNGDASARFIYYQMTTRDFQRRVRENAGQATLPIINKSKWGSLAVALPPSLEEQIGILQGLDAMGVEVDSLREVLARKLTALDELKKSLLHQAFTGQLTAKSTDQQLEAVA